MPSNHKRLCLTAGVYEVIFRRTIAFLSGSRFQGRFLLLAFGHASNNRHGLRPIYQCHATEHGG